MEKVRLNKDEVRSWTAEKRGEYQRQLQQQMAQLAIFHEDLVQVRIEKGDFYRGNHGETT